MKYALLIAVLFSSLAVAAPSDLQPWQEYPTIEITADVPSIETLELAPKWRINCSTDADPLVGKIESAAPGLDGRTLLLDSQLVQVLVVSPDGDIERTAGRPGEGPGDLPGA